MARPPLLEYFEAVSIALGRRLLTREQASVAVLLGVRESDSLTGENVTVDAAQLAAELDVSSRTIWRYVSALIAGGWMEQTEAPTRGRKGERGRKARYRLTASGLDVALESRVTALAASVAREERGTAESCDIWDESCATAERQLGTVLPTDGLSPLPHPSAGGTGHAREDLGGWMESTA